MISDPNEYVEEVGKRSSLDLNEVVETETFEDELVAMAKKVEARIDELVALSHSKYLHVRKREFVAKLITTNKAVYSAILAIKERKHNERRKNK